MMYNYKTSIGILFFAVCLGNVFAQKNNANNVISKSPFEHQVFVENINQFDLEKSLGENFDFYATSKGIEVFFKKNKITYIHRQPAQVSMEERERYEEQGMRDKLKELYKPTVHEFNIEWLGSNNAVMIQAEEKQEFYYTYANPSDNTKTIKTNCYKKITYRNLYPNIDVEYVMHEKGGIKYSIIVHPGGDISKVKYKYTDSKNTTVDFNGNLLMESTFGVFTETAPISFLYHNNQPIKSSFQLDNNIIGFVVEDYDHSESLVIDPWINNPSFTTLNQAYDVNFDMSGNVYAHGSIWPYKVVKYNKNGVLQWMYNCPGGFGTSAGPTYGDFAVDQVSQSVYIGEGYDQSFLNVLKLNFAGVLQATYPGTCSPNMNEIWRMDYNRCINKIVIGGGGTGSVRNQFALMDTTLGTNAVTPYNPLNANQALHDVSLLAFDPTGSHFFGASVRSTLNPLNHDNRLLKMNSNTIIPALFNIYDTYTFQEGLTQSGFGWQNGQFACGFNGLACGQQYVYLYDGNKLQQRSKVNGALVNQVLTSGLALGCAGITVDPCENIYVAANGSVEVYDINLNLINTLNTNNAIYDLKLGPKGQLYFCGEGQVGVLTVTNSAPVVSVATTANTSCIPSLCNGTATVSVSCGSPSNYTFTWSGGQTTQSVTGLCSGTYTVIVSTACIFIDTLVFTINNNPVYPSVTMSSPLALNCAVTSGNVFVNSIPSTGVTYNWSGPGIVSGATSASATVNAPGTYTVIVTITASGCTSSGTVTVTQDITTPNVSANPGFTLTCTTTSGTISATSTTPGINWSWAGPSVISGGSSSTATVNGPGTYTVTVTNPINFCTNTATVVVNSDNSIPTLTAGPPVTLNCLILSDTITATSSTVGVTFSWSGPGIVSGGNTNSPIVNQPGNYTVIVTEPNSGCTTVGSVLVINDKTPPSVTANPSFSITCVVASDTISVTSNVSNATYNWSGPGIVSGANTTSPIVNTAGTYTVTVTNPTNGCTSTATIIVGIDIAPPNVTAGNPLTLTCVVTSDTIGANSTTQNVTYNWSGPGIVSGSTTSNPTVNLPGTYTVVVTNPLNGCTSTATVIVNQNITPPNVTLSSTTVTLTCSTTNSTLTASSSTSGVYYNWSGPGIVSGGTTSSPVINAVGTYTVIVTDPINGCTNSATVNVVSNVTAPTVVAGSDQILTCLITSTNISANSPAAGATYSWFGPGIVSGGNTSSPTVNQSGVYIVTVTDPATGCTNTTSVQVTVAPLPTATAAQSTTIVLGNSTQLVATGGPSYSWSPSYALSCTSCANPIASPAITTVYCVTVTDQYGCKDSACVTITVFDPCPPKLDQFPIPNVFSPNEDGKNDVFFLKGWDDECIEEFSVEIYDRWGLKMFESVGSNVHWDGRTSSGLIAPDGTYFYLLTVKRVRAEAQKYRGALNLVR